MRVPAGLLALAILGLPEKSAAQQALAVEPGQRVRATFELEERTSHFDGFYHGADADSLFLRVSTGGVQAWPWRNVVRVERFVGRRGHSGLGALIGAGVGLAAGIPLGIIAKRESQFIQIGTGEAILIAASFTAAGAGLGALVGLGVRSDRWQTVPLAALRPSRSSR